MIPMKIIKEQGIKNLYFWLITIMIVIVSIEGGLRLIVYFAKHYSPNNWDVIYNNEEWSKDLHREIDEISFFKFAPFYHWETKEYHGKYVNINSDGMRKTWNPENKSAQVMDSIYVFGGSTIMGTSRDYYTIPSYLSKKLNKTKNNYMVYNCAGDAYTFPQEVIRLIVLLNKGHRPRYVIFYDGVNDVYAAYQSGIPGSIQNLKDISHIFQSSRPRLFWEWVCSRIRDKCMLINGLNKLKKEIVALYRPEVSKFDEAAASYDDNHLKILSNNIIESYIRWKDMVDNLSKAYNFDYYCFWQPVIYTEEKVFPIDSKGDPRLNDKSLAKLYKYTNASLGDKSIHHFWNISNVLRDKTSACYIDWCHITEEGNDMVAEKIFKIFKEKN